VACTPSVSATGATFVNREGAGSTRYPEGVGQVHELSRVAYDRLRAELDQLTTEGRIDIAHKIEAARALGDLSENGDYHAAKDQQGKMEARIRQLTALLQDAVVVDDRPVGDAVAVGTVVTLRFDGDDDVERYLVGSIEERDEDLEVVSPQSPLGSAVIGAKPGESRTYEVSGRTLKVEIVGIGR
jgi:transcription elongation factor GreA